MRKVAVLEAGRPDVDIQLVNTTTERDHLAAECKAADKMNKYFDFSFYKIFSYF